MKQVRLCVQAKSYSNSMAWMLVETTPVADFEYYIPLVHITWCL